MSILNRFIYFLALVFVLCSCSSKKNIVQVEETEDVVTRRLFYAYADSCATATSSVGTFFSKGISFEAENFSAPRLNMNLFISCSESFISTLSLPFPPVEIGRCSVSDDKIYLKSSYTEIKSPMAIGYNVQPVMEAVVLGKLPPIYLLFGETNFNSFDVYTKEDSYYIERTDATLPLRVVMELSNNFILNNLSIYNSETYCRVACDNYAEIDNLNIPKLLQFSILYNGNNYVFALKQNKIDINGNKKLNFD